MPWVTVVTMLVENAPAIIDSAGKFISWAGLAIKDLEEAYNKPASEITREELLARLDKIQALSDQIQASD